MSALLVRIGLPIGLLLVSSCLALGGAELAVRIALPQYVSIQTDRAIWEPHERLGWIGRPHSDVLQGFDADRRVAVHINARGFRDDDADPMPPEGRTRLLVLGDSVAFGFGVPLESRFSEVIERRRSDVEFVNLGVSGYSTDQELLLFREEGRRYGPAGVILLFVVNDPVYNGQPLGHGHPKPTLTLEGEELVLGNVPVPRSEPLLRAKYFLMRHSALFNLARERLRNAARETGLNRLAGDEALVGGGARVELDRDRLTRGIVTRLREEVEAAGARLLVVTAITNADLAENQRANAELLAWCPQVGLECVDTYPAFRRRHEEDPDAELFLQDRAHWSALGHELAAGVIERTLVERGWLSPAALTGDAAGTRASDAP